MTNASTNILLTKGVGTFLFEGDIILTEEQKLALFHKMNNAANSSRTKRSCDSLTLSGGAVNTWPSATVPYIMDEELSKYYKIDVDIA